MIAMYIVFIFGMMSPGPDTIVIIRSTLKSRAHGLATAYGVVFGNIFYLYGALFGLDYVLDNHPLLGKGIKLGGSILLIYLGSKGLLGFLNARSESSSQVSHKSRTKKSKIDKLSSSFMLGLATNLLNPKVVVFFTAVFSQFIKKDVIFLEKMLIGASLWALCIAYFTLLVLAASHKKFRGLLEQYQEKINLALSIVLLVLGVAVLYKNMDLYFF